MNISYEEKKAEAIRRMRLLGLWDETIKYLDEEGHPMVFEPPLGIAYWVIPGNEHDELCEEVEKFEKEYNALVYCVIRSNTEIGVMDSLLYVGDERDEWASDYEDLMENIVFSYTINYDSPWCSEFGSIGVHRTIAGGLVRTE